MTTARSRAKFHLRTATDSSYDDTTSASVSRPTSPTPLLNIPRASSPLQQRSLGASISSASQLELDGKGKSVANDEEKEEHVTDIGILDDEVYDRYLSKPIGRIRRILVWSLRKETPLLAWQQKKFRSRLRDRYFVYTSLLGTHSFFLIFLPTTYWLGNRLFARGLVNVLALGVFASSAVKDWLCVPRPYSPPVTRLTIGTHHLEYGFPSTHSTNAVSIAFYIYLWVRSLRERFETGSIWHSYLWEGFLLYYCISVVYGRIYAGMHSIVDCVSGSLLGIGLSLLQWSYSDHMEAFLNRSDWTPPLVIIPLGLLMVTFHPQPLDDCPCFEDAIAFVAVAMGTTLGKWAFVKAGLMPMNDLPPVGVPMIRLGTTTRLLPRQLGQLGDVLESVLDRIVPTVNSILGIKPKGVDLAGRIAASTSMLVFGVTVIILVRIIAKTVCRAILPPIIRFMFETFGLVLPRRHYLRATEYNKLPPIDGGLQAVPSLIDLPSTLTPSAELGQGHLFANSPGTGTESPAWPHRPQSPASPTLLSPDDGLSSANSSRAPSPNPLQQGRSIYRGASQTSGSGDRIAEQLAEVLSKKNKKKRSSSGNSGKANGLHEQDEEEGTKRHDAEVLTKVIVYFSIGFTAATVLPAVFERFGWTA